MGRTIQKVLALSLGVPAAVVVVAASALLITDHARAVRQARRIERRFSWRAGAMRSDHRVQGPTRWARLVKGTDKSIN